MSSTISQQSEREVASWSGVVVKPHRFGGIEFLVGRREIALTAKEYALLEFLVRHAGEVVSRAAIAEHVWDEHYDPASNVVDVYIQRLRRKLEEAGADSLIRTRRGEGYQLVA